MKRRELMLGALAGMMSLTACAQVESAAKSADAPELHAAMRGLWHDHIVATRDYALAVHAGDAAAGSAAEAAAVANAKDIAGAVAGFYGDDAGAGTLDLLGGHWGGVKAYTDAAKAGDQAGQDQAMADLAGNARQIAEFFAGANPDNWTVDGLNSALLGHVGHHKLQIDAMMADAPAAEQEQLWQEMSDHMDMIADALSDGLAKQFPDKVS